MGRKGEKQRARKGDGSIGKYRRGYRGQIVVVDALGRRKRKTVYGRNEGEVRTKFLRLRVEATNHRSDGKEQLGDFLDRWIDAHADEIRYGTAKDYRLWIRAYLKPLLGHLSLKELEPSHVQAMLKSMRDAGKSPRTRQVVLVTLKTALEHALDLELVDRNVALRIKAPRVPKAKRIAWSPQQVGFFFQALRLRDDRLIPLYFTALMTGMRQSELLGLRWRYVDFDRKVIRVERRLDAKTRDLDDPKTPGSFREVPMTASLIAELRAQRKRMANERLSQWVFVATNGVPLRPSNFYRRSFKPATALADALARADAPEDCDGVPLIHFHDLRHTAGVLMRRRGVDLRTISDILGHSSVAFTQSVYGHIIPDLDRDAVEALESLFEFAPDLSEHAK